MGQLLSATRTPIQYHRRYYNKGTIELATSRGGSKGKPHSPHLFTRYTDFLNEIPDVVSTLCKECSAIRVAHGNGEPLEAHFKKVRDTIEAIRRKYEYFFRDSYYTHDRGVNKRKKMLVDAFFDLEGLQDEILAITSVDNPDFEKIKNRAESQLEAVMSVISHFRRYHPDFVQSPVVLL